MKKGESIGELLATSFKPRKSLLGPWLLAGTASLLFAGTGLGKTFLSLEMAYAVGSGKPFLKWEVPMPSRVCLFDAEMGLEALHRRLTPIDKNSGEMIRGDFLHIVTQEHFGDKMPNLSDPKDQLIYEEESKNCELIVIDNLMTCSRGMNERDSDFSQWLRIQDWIIRLRNQQQKAFLIVHHAGKSGEQWGTSQKENIMHNVIFLKRPQKAREIDGFECEWRFNKARDLEKNEDREPLYIEYTSGGKLLWTPLKARIEASVSELASKGLKHQEIAKELGLAVFEVSDALKSVEAKQLEFKGYKNDTGDADLF